MWARPAPTLDAPTLELLSAFCVRYGDHAVDLRPSARRLIALLAVAGPHSRSDAASSLWPDVSRARAASNLRTARWRLRQDAPGLLLDEGGVLGLGNVDCDLTEVREWAQRTIAGEQGEIPEHGTAELLPGWGDVWLIEQREELRLLQLQALEASAERLLTGGRLAAACRNAHAAAMMDPLRESAARLLIEIHVREGNLRDAVLRFHRFQHLLAEELGVQPSPAMTSLVAPFLKPESGSPRRIARSRGRPDTSVRPHGTRSRP